LASLIYEKVIGFELAGELDALSDDDCEDADVKAEESSQEVFVHFCLYTTMKDCFHPLVMSPGRRRNYTKICVLPWKGIREALPR
jgi:hypothetical protein